MKTVCAENMCSGCGACSDVCPCGAVTFEDSLRAANVRIDENPCVDCGRCHSVCPQNNPAELREPLEWFEGWANTDELRVPSSSGGIAAAVCLAFAQRGGVVCSCLFAAGHFGFAFAQDACELAAFRGSKYVRSDARGAYSEVKTLLREGREVLFVGLPCQVSALRRFVGAKLEERLYTADLICHGTPSVLLLQRYLSEHKVNLANLAGIDFRRKGSFQLRDGERCIVTPGVCDAYLMAFLNGLDYGEGCYSCNFACRQRVGDLTLGDSWGTTLEADEARRGISLVLCQTDKGQNLLDAAEVHVQPTDADVATASNEQLRRPYVVPKQRETFFSAIEAGKSFDSAVRKCLPKQAAKQALKGVLIRLRILPGGYLVYGISVIEGHRENGDRK